MNSTVTNKLVQAKKQRFLKKFSELGSISATAKETKIARDEHYRWMRLDEQYREQFAEAEVIAAKTLEDEAVRRGRDGVDRPVVHQGQFTYPPGKDGKPDTSKPPLSIREYSDTLLIFLMKGAMPEKYRENIAVQHSGSVDFVGRLSAGRERVSGVEMAPQLTTSEPIEAQFSAENAQ